MAEQEKEIAKDSQARNRKAGRLVIVTYLPTYNKVQIRPEFFHSGLIG